MRTPELQKSRSSRSSADALISRNAALMREYSIESQKDLEKALGDLYDSETRNALMNNLSAEDQVDLRAFYYRKCRGGLDRAPACIKISIDWEQTSPWIERDKDGLETMKAVFDRIGRNVKYSCKTRYGGKISISSHFDAKFEEQLFENAEEAWWGPEKIDGPYALDANTVSVKCIFGNRQVRSYFGNVLSNPYCSLYEKAQNLFSHLMQDLI